MNTAPFRTLIDAATLAQYIDSPDWIVVDLRHELTNPQAGRDAYDAGHIPGAIFLSVDDDLAAPNTGRNGRHPLPHRDEFAARLAALGVGDDTQVIAYDAHGGMYAARLWWMLRWLGHEQVAVLDGGWSTWLQSDLPITQTIPAARTPAQLTVKAALTRQVDVNDVLANLDGGPLIVVDARAPDRYRGENETIDPIGGHIPAARNRFFRDNLDGERFKSPAELRKEWRAVLDGKESMHVVAQCGSGITACHNLLALEIAGLPGAALYPGSWSEWCSEPSRPIAQGQDPVRNL